MTILSYPQNLMTHGGEYPHYVTFTNLKKGKPQNSVALYLPAEALKSSYTQSFADADLGAMGVALAGEGGDAAAAAMSGAMQGTGGGGLLNMITSLAVGGAKGAAETNLGPAVAQWTLNSTMKSADAKFGGAINALKKKSGLIVNPHKAILYSGPGGFRTFSFNYVMTPENVKEATAIADIVHYFKLHMHPGTPSYDIRTKDTSASASGYKTTSKRTVEGGINTSMSLSYPDEFQIKMSVNRKHKDKSRNAVFNIKNCFLESLNVDYTTSGAAAFITTGAMSVPATTTMAMTFKETELMTKNSIEQGF